MKAGISSINMSSPTGGEGEGEEGKGSKKIMTFDVKWPCRQ